VEIRDDGPGFAPEVLLRVGEPYVTTRGSRRLDQEGGSGLGLGLFIAKTLIERSGAQLILTNAALPGTGAVARVVWSRAQFETSTPEQPSPLGDRDLTPHPAAPISAAQA